MKLKKQNKTPIQFLTYPTCKVVIVIVTSLHFLIHNYFQSVEVDVLSNMKGFKNLNMTFEVFEFSNCRENN